MRTFVAIIIGLVFGFFVGALAGYGGVDLLAPNQHDRALEAAMTALFVTGPIGGVLGALIAWLRARSIT